LPRRERGTGAKNHVRHDRLDDLVAQVKEASHNIKRADDAFGKRLDGLENSINELYKKTSRPGGFGGGFDDASFERKDAVEMCRIKHALDVPKIETAEYVPPSAQIDAAIAARRGLRALIRHGDTNSTRSSASRCRRFRSAPTRS
jgi:hypothetical protein